MFRTPLACLLFTAAFLTPAIASTPATAQDFVEPPLTVVVASGATSVTRLALAPDWLYGTDATGLWVRQGSSAFSERTVLSARFSSSSLSASAGRAIVPGSFVERGKLARDADHLFNKKDIISGPRALSAGWQEIIDVDGQTLRWNRPLSIFGQSTLVSGSLSLEGAPLHTPPEGQYLQDVWGHWVRSYEGPLTHITNWVTKSSASIDSSLYGKDGLLGDGVYVTAINGIINVFDVTGTGELEPVLTFEGTPKSIERNRLAWVDPQGVIKVSTLPVGGMSNAIYLGAAGVGRNLSITKPWDFGLDFSAPLASGRVEIRDGNGALVRSIPTPATRDGSLRLKWDVRNAAGQPARNGAHTWEFIGKDNGGRSATALVPGRPISGSVTVALNQFVVPFTPDFYMPCGRTEAVLDLPEVPGVEYSYSSVDEAVRTVTAKALPGWVMTGTSRWTLKPRLESCDGIVAAPKFIDEPGTHRDRIVIPKAVEPVSDYWVDGTRLLAGTYEFYTGRVVVEAHFSSGAKPLVWRHTFSSGGPIDVYTTPGEHVSNGRQWRTSCEPYSVTTRCNTEIWATTTRQEGSTFTQKNGWVFNNLTYLPSPRSVWKNNKLGETATWTAGDGRNWRTECDTAATGRGGCRSYTQAKIITATPKSGGGATYKWETQWLFNNMVRFS